MNNGQAAAASTLQRKSKVRTGGVGDFERRDAGVPSLGFANQLKSSKNPA